MTETTTRSNGLWGGVSKALTFVLVAIIRVYQRLVSPLFPSVCRFHPTCSQYACEAILTHGPLRGLWLALKRIARCHPFGGSGYDPVR